jgi:hypothetical protein
VRRPDIKTSTAHADYDVRGALTLSGDSVSGWCWSPRYPNERLRVEVLVNDRVVASGIAARLVLELVRPGISDGYHGFFLPLPSRLSAEALLEARESATGYVFARLLPRRMVDTADWTKQVVTLSTTLGHLHAKLGEVASGRMLATLSAALTASGAFLEAKVAPPLHHPYPVGGLALRSFPKPKWSIVLDIAGMIGSTDEMALQEVEAIAPLLTTARAELLAADDGRAAAALTAVSGLNYCKLPPGLGTASRINQAAEIARGEQLAVFGGRKASLAARATLLRDSDPHGVVIGCLAVETARAAGLAILCPNTAHGGPETGLKLLTSAETFAVIGPLDPALEDGADLPILDFALRAQAVGYAVSFRQEPPPRRSPLGPEAAVARARFIRRWGAQASQRPQEPFLPC